MDNGKVTALTLLDLSAAFDTIDHSTLLERLHVHFGISGTVFQWFKSYISNRQQRVHIDGSLSCAQYLHFGVPQGSVLGPFLFCLYTTSISQMINTHDVSHHMYADDTQVYIELSQSVLQHQRWHSIRLKHICLSLLLYYVHHNVYLMCVIFWTGTTTSTVAQYPTKTSISEPPTLLCASQCLFNVCYILDRHYSIKGGTVSD